MNLFKSSLLMMALLGTMIITQSCEKDEPCEEVNCENDTRTIQQKLNAGQTPLGIFDQLVSEGLSSENTLDSLYGKMYEGGLIFYLNTTDGTGMVAAAEDQSVGTEWGCSGESTGVDEDGLGAGAQNTTNIINSCSTVGIAAKLCQSLELNGKNDWYLPSKDELSLMWKNLADSDGDGENFGPDDPGNISGFVIDGYWSSTEIDSVFAWYHYFIDDYVGGVNKRFDRGYVRAARAF